MNAGTIIYVHFDIILQECTLTVFWLTNLEISGLQALGGFIIEWFHEWDESNAHAASSMISPPAQRLAPEALHSIDNLAV